MAHTTAAISLTLAYTHTCKSPCGNRAIAPLIAMQIALRDHKF
jgi:hypothetical protein